MTHGILRNTNSGVEIPGTANAKGLDVIEFTIDGSPHSNYFARGSDWEFVPAPKPVPTKHRSTEITAGSRVRVLEGSRAFDGKPGAAFTVTRVVRHVNPHEDAPQGFDWYAEGKTDVGEHAAAWGHFLEAVPTPEPPSSIIYGDEIEAVRQAIDSFEWEVDRFFENPSDARNLERAAWGIFSAVHDLTRELAGVEE